MVRHSLDESKGVCASFNPDRSQPRHLYMKTPSDESYVGYDMAVMAGSSKQIGEGIASNEAKAWQKRGSEYCCTINAVEKCGAGI